ncbi:hypothetical protein HYQ44_004346 [Verticillium longisporum]|nr:hypothetical protein HYQ44_004346 [Verticillium longisporum]
MPKRVMTSAEQQTSHDGNQVGSEPEPITVAARTRSSRRQPPRSFSSTPVQLQAGKSTATAVEIDEGEVSASARKERKRLTDRVAQREHRKRQKQYIEELEAQLSMLKEGGQSDVAQLAARNLRLYDELKQMHALWDEMEQLLLRQRQLRRTSTVNLLSARPDSQIDTQLDMLVAREGGQTTTDEPLQPGQASRYTGSHDGSQSPYADALPDADPDRDNSDMSQIHDAAGQAISTAPQHSMFIMPEDQHRGHESSRGRDHLHSTVDHSTSTVTSGSHRPSLLSSADDGMEFSLATMSHDSWQRTHQQHVPSQTRPFEPTWESWTRSHEDASGDQLNQRTFAARPYPTNNSFQRGTTPYENQTTMPNPENLSILELLENYVGQCVSPLSLCFPNPSDGPRHHQILPLVTSPNMPQDIKVQAMIERTRVNMQHVGPPKLSDFLFDDPQNTLSLDLKMFLEPLRRARRTSEYLAGYWVLYLFFRWQALQTEDAFLSLPTWLRPTPLQLNIYTPMLRTS